MTEPPSSSAGVPSAGIEVENLPVVFSTSSSSAGARKRSAAEAREGDSVEDLQDKETTLDDVFDPPLAKKSKLLDEELPDVDDNEEFPHQTEETDEDLAISLENGDNDLTMDEEALILATDGQNMEEKDREGGDQLNGDELGPSEDDDEDEEEEEDDEEAEDSEPLLSQHNELDIVDVEEEEEEEEADGYEQSGGQEDDEEDEDAQETARAIARAQNQSEARELLRQLDDSARSKLCLTAMEKYGEELFYGHEDARDAILVDACAQDSILSLMRDAIRVRDLYLRGSSAAVPLELDDEDGEGDEQEGENELGGYEDEEEEDADEDEDEEKSTGSIEGSDDEIVVISEEEEGDGEDSEAPNSTLCSPRSEVHPSGATYANVSGANCEEVGMPHSAREIRCDSDPDDGYGGDDSEQLTMEGEALGNVGVAGDSASGLPIDDEVSPLPVQKATPES